MTSPRLATVRVPSSVSAVRAALGRVALVLAAVALASGAASAAAPKPKPKGKPKADHVVFVAMPLLPGATAPSPDAVLAAYVAMAPGGPELGYVKTPDASGPQSYLIGEDVVTVELVAGAVPERAADDAAAASLYGFLKDWRPAAHAAHVVVAYAPDPKRPRAKAYVDFLRVTGAVAKAGGAVGVYLTGGGLTSPTDFFVDAVSQKPPLVVAYTGIRRVFERDPGADETTPPTRFGLLSGGMGELGLPELYFTSPIAKASDGLEYFLDLLSYEVGLGKAPPSGDTVGRGPDEKLLVHYEDSPSGDGKKIWRVDLP